MQAHGPTERIDDTPNALGLVALGGGFAFLAIAAATIVKGVVPAFQAYGGYFWLNTYRHGFVRRGLVGSLLAPWLESADNVELLNKVLLIHIGAIFLVLLACTVIGVWATSRLGWRMVLALALLATSPFFGSITFNFGFYDALLCAEIIVGVLLLWHGVPWWLLAGWLVIEALTHESALLITMFMAPIACMRLGGVQRLAGVLVGGALGVIAVLVGGAPDPGLAERVVALGLPPELAPEALRVFAHQTVGKSLSVMAGNWLSYPARGFTGLAYTGLPAALMMLLFWSREDWRRRLAYVLGGLGPCLLLTLAWDVTRVASISALTSFLTVSLFSSHPPTAAGTSGWRAASALVLCLGYLAMPIIDLRLPHEARPINLTLIRGICATCAEAGVGFASWYGLVDHRQVSPLEDPALGNGR